MIFRFTNYTLLLLFFVTPSLAKEKPCDTLAKSEKVFLADFCQENSAFQNLEASKDLCNSNETKRTQALLAIADPEKRKPNWGNQYVEIHTTCSKKKEVKITKFVVNTLQVKTIVQSIAKLDQLKHLYLTGNDIQTLPKELGKLKQLETLGLSKNQIQDVPRSLGELKNLALLSLSHNQIQKLPDSLGNLTKLSFLELENNKIKELPDNLANLQNLSFLNISNNPLKEKPVWISQLKDASVLVD